MSLAEILSLAVATLSGILLPGLLSRAREFRAMQIDLARLQEQSKLWAEVQPAIARLSDTVSKLNESVARLEARLDSA